MARPIDEFHETINRRREERAELERYEDAHGSATLEPPPDTERNLEPPSVPPPPPHPSDFTTAHGGTRGEDCAVDSKCVRGDESEWFEVHYAATGEVFHFCARHALAAEALVMLGGWRARDVPDGLRMLDGLERARAREAVELKHVGTLVKCGQEKCGLLAVYEYDWPGATGPKFACLPCGTRVQSVARAMGFMVTLRPLVGAPESLARNGG